MAKKRKSTGVRGSVKGKSKSSVVHVDFTDVEVRVHLPPGIYHAKVEEVTKETTENKNEMLSWKFRTIDKDKKLHDKPLFYNTVLVPQSLWVLGALLDALGVDRPEGPMDLDLTELPGQELELIVEEGEYKNKPTSEVMDFQALRDEDEEEEEGGAIVEDGADDGEDTYTEEEIMAMDADELDEVVTDEELGIKSLKKLAKYRTRVLEALKESNLIGTGEKEEESTPKSDDDGDDDDELYTVDEIKKMDKEELIELVATEELDVKSEQKTLRRLQNKVIDALDEAELLQDEIPF